MAIKYYLSILACLFTLIASADVIMPGEVDKQFKIINLYQFKGYSFSYQYQHYKYDKGYQPNGVSVITLVNDSTFGTGRGGAVNITATNKAGKSFVSNIKVGGSGRYYHNVVDVVEVFKIVSIKNGVLQLKKVKELVTSSEKGKLITTEKKVGILAGLENPWLIGLVLTALFSGAILFLLKTKRNNLAK